MKNLSLVLICTGILFASGCTTRKFMFNSNPEGAFIVGYGETTNDKPIDGTVTFLGKSDTYGFVLEIYLKSLNPALLAYYPKPLSILDMKQLNDKTTKIKVL